MPFDIPTFNANSTDTNNTVIEKNVSKFENKKSIEEQENEVANIIIEELKNEWIFEYFPKWIEVKKIDTNIFFIIDNNTNKPYIYVDKMWNNLINIPYRYTEEWIKNDKNWNPWKAMIKAWFVFWKNLELHKIVWYENGSLIIKWKVDTNSKEYYLAWKKIIRASWDIFVNTILHSNSKTKFHHNSFDALLDTWAVNKENLEKINAKWVLTEEDYQFWLEFFKKQEEQEKNKLHIDEAIDNINSRLNWVTMEIPKNGN